MRLSGEERREFQRLTVEPTIPGTLGDLEVQVLEIGVLGARVRHRDPVAAEYAELRFEQEGASVTMRCEVVRSIGNAPSIESGLRFLAAVGESGDRLREILARLVGHELEVRRNMPRHIIPTQAAVDGDRTVRGKDAGFVCYRLEAGHWKKTRAFLPEQPSAGFTVARWVDPLEVQRLCQVFEAADAEGRRLIQLFAELSVSDELEIPPSA